jgi:hypothetical protein
LPLIDAELDSVGMVLHGVRVVFDCVSVCLYGVRVRAYRMRVLG